MGSDVVDHLRGRSLHDLGTYCSRILEVNGASVDWDRRRCRWCGNTLPDHQRFFCGNRCIADQQRSMVRSTCPHPVWTAADDEYGPFERCDRCGAERAMDGVDE